MLPRTEYLYPPLRRSSSHVARCLPHTRKKRSQSCLCRSVLFPHWQRTLGCQSARLARRSILPRGMIVSPSSTTYHISCPSVYLSRIWRNKETAIWPHDPQPRDGHQSLQLYQVNPTPSLTAGPVCEDDRQWVPGTGQKWTTLEAATPPRRNTLLHDGPLTYIQTEPGFAINQTRKSVTRSA